MHTPQLALRSMRKKALKALKNSNYFKIGISVTTQDVYFTIIKRFFESINKNPNKVTIKDIERYLENYKVFSIPLGKMIKADR